MRWLWQILQNSINFYFKYILTPTAAIRQKMYEYIRFADDKKVKAIYTMVAEEVNEINE